jgi:alpha-galactosidase
MTAAENRTHVSLWAMLAAPLIAGHDVRSSTPETIALLTNRQVIAIDQDPLGRPGRRVVQHEPLEVWTRPLDGNRTAVARFKRGTDPATVEASFAELGIEGRPAAADAWAQRSVELPEGRVSAQVEPHGVVLLVLQPSTPAAK